MKSQLHLLIISVLMTSVFFACNSEKSTDATDATQATNQTSAPVELTYPAYPNEKIQYLLQNCDFIDYVFYQLPISMSLNEKPTIQYAISHITTKGAPINTACQAIGRIFYQIKGENVAEADIFFNQGCTYFVFYENQKKTYCSQISNEGIKYLNNNIAQAAEMQKQMQQGGGSGN